MRTNQKKKKIPSERDLEGWHFLDSILGYNVDCFVVFLAPLLGLKFICSYIITLVRKSFVEYCHSSFIIEKKKKLTYRDSSEIQVCI